jgi:hypothetical protein
MVRKAKSNDGIDTGAGMPENERNKFTERAMRDMTERYDL